MKSQGKLVSVIIPCYNHGKFLEETLASVIASDYVNLEIIIVDDGSQDDSFEVMQKLAEMKRTRSLNIQAISQANAGPARARNTGISNAKGSYILPLDADDKISRNYISQAVKTLERDAYIKVVYAKARKFGRVNKAWTLKPYSPRNLAMDNMIYVSGVFRKSDWERVNGFTENPVLVREDWEFWIKILKNGGLAYQLPFVGFYYRIHPASRRKSMTKQKKALEVAYLNEHHIDYFEQHLNGPLRTQRSLSRLINFFIRPSR